MNRTLLIPALMCSLYAMQPHPAEASCSAAVTPINARVPTANSVDIVHVYWGSYWRTPASYAQAQTAAWDDILQQTAFGSPWFWPLWQYAIPTGTPMNGHFLGGLYFDTSLDLSGNHVVTFTEIEAEIETDAAPWMPNDGRTKLFVIYLPPNVITDAMVGNNTIGYHFHDEHRSDFQLLPIKYQANQDTVFGPSANEVESHELIETIANPSHQGWHLAGHTEIADLCQPQTYTWTGTYGTYHLSQFFSNASCACAPL